MNIDIGKFQRKAIDIISKEGMSETNKQKIVAFVLNSKGHILTSGWNSYVKTHPAQKRASSEFNEDFKCYMHAETMSLTKLSYKQLGKQHAIVVIRLDSHNQLLPGHPCKICSSVIKKYGIENIIHS